MHEALIVLNLNYFMYLRIYCLLEHISKQFVIIQRMNHFKAQNTEVFNLLTDWKTRQYQVQYDLWCGFN